MISNAPALFSGMISEGIVAVSWSAPARQFPKASLFLSLVSEAQIERVVVKNARTRERSKHTIRSHVHGVVRPPLIGEMRMITSPLGVIRFGAYFQNITNCQPSPDHMLRRPSWNVANLVLDDGHIPIKSVEEEQITRTHALIA